MLHERVPFDGDRKAAIEYVVKEDSRPKIQDEVDIEISKIIRLCWQKEANSRPTFHEIQNSLRDE